MFPVMLTLGESIDKIFYNFDLWVFHFFGSIQNELLNYVAKFFTTLQGLMLNIIVQPRFA